MTSPSGTKPRPHIVVEDDRVLRLLAVVLDPDTAQDRVDAWADFVAHDEPDFAGWLESTRAAVPGLFPARLSFVADQDELRAKLADADASVVESLKIGTEELGVAPRLAFVQKFGTVTANLDLEAIAERDISVDLLPRRQNVAVAEHALAMMLALARRLPELTGRVSTDSLRQGGFDPTPFDRRYMANSNFARVPGLRTLKGSTVGVLGMGEIGREFAARAKAFGMRVLYHQRSRISVEDEVRLSATHVSLQELFEQSDYVSIHLPLNDATQGIVGPSVLARMKPGPIIVNTARAPLVDREALMQALDEGRLAAYGLDVGYAEPAEPDDPLIGRPNVLLTPHTAPGSRHNGLDDIADLVGNIHRGLFGE